jgi:hypothetical protein
MSYTAGGRQYIVVAAGGHDRLTLGPPALGDYVLAFALDAPGTPAPDTTSHALTGRWAGELRVEDHERFAMTLDLAVAGDSLAGPVSADSGHIRGRLALRRTGRKVSFRLPFEYQARHCGGEMIGDGEEANGGTLLVGTLLVHSSCSDHDEPGTLSLRRRE